jgi:Anthrone oxygenase
MPARASTLRGAARVIDGVAVAATSAFAGGALVSQTVVVPDWRAMEPAVFLARFPITGPATGATVFPFELCSVLLLGIVAHSAVKRRRSGRLTWALATACMLGTFVLLIYFVPTNLALLNPAFPPQAVSAELATWYRWNWVRTGLGLAAAVLACTALIVDRSENAPARS